MFRVAPRRLHTALIPTANCGKTVVFGGDARELMLNGIERIAKAVGVTLGPKGRNVIIRQPNGEPKITKDGVTVARSIEFSDQFEDVGARLIRQVASKTNDAAGDGTTTATVLAWQIFQEGYKSVATGANPMDLKRGIDHAVKIIIDDLKKQTKSVNDAPTLENVATISANGERPMGKMIADAVTATGVDGFISVLDGTSTETKWTKHAGWSTETGFINSLLVTDQVELTSDVQTPFVFISSDELASVPDLLRLLDTAVLAKRPLVLVAPKFSDAVLQTVVANHVGGVLQCIVVAIAPREGELQDLAVACGTSVNSSVSLQQVSDAAVVLGSAAFARQSMDSTVIAGTADISGRVRLLQAKFARTLGDEERNILRERASKLNKNFAVIRVGGHTSVEISESKDRVIDALNASKNALAEGIVAGGGSALLHASKKLDVILETDEEMDQDRRTGVFIVRNAVRLPIRLIADNAGVEGAVIIDNVMEMTDTAMGYDAQNDKFVNMFDAGIIDPVKVVISTIVDAASVAGLMITTEASVCDHVDQIRHAKLS